MIELSVRRAREQRLHFAVTRRTYSDENEKLLKHIQAFGEIESIKYIEWASEAMQLYRLCFAHEDPNLAWRDLENVDVLPDYEAGLWNSRHRLLVRLYKILIAKSPVAAQKLEPPKSWWSDV